MEMLKIQTRNLELTDRLRTYVEKKVSKFDRYLPNIDSVRVDLAESNSRDSARRMVAQITVNVPRAILRAEEKGSDIFAAIDAVMDKMYRRVERYKGRHVTARRSPVAGPEEPMETAPVAAADVEEEMLPTIVRVKEFEVSSVTPEEAIEQMELLEHTFYLFLDANDGRISLVYRRDDGNYGMLKPQY